MCVHGIQVKSDPSSRAQGRNWVFLERMFLAPEVGFPLFGSIMTPMSEFSLKAAGPSLEYVVPKRESSDLKTCPFSVLLTSRSINRDKASGQGRAFPSECMHFLPLPFFFN